MSKQETTQGFDGWAILELMGHVRLAGRVTEESHFGVALGRIDIPNGGGFTTQYFGGSSVYRLTPTTEEIARSVALNNQPQPVHRWELPAPTKADIPAEPLYSDDLPFDEDRDDAYNRDE
jgi:hypothetical protein